MAIIRTLGVAVKAKTTNFNKGIKGAKKTLMNFAAGMGNVIKSAARMGAALAAAALAGVVILTKKTLAGADEQIKFAKRLGLSQEALAGFELANEKAGNEAGAFRKALQNQQKATSEAAQGLGVAMRAFADLNIEADDLLKLPVDEQMFVIADALEKVENQTKKTRIAYEIFGGRGVGLINTLRGGSKALKETRKEAGLLGLTLSGSAARGIEEANDAVTELGALLKGSVLQLVSRLAPAIEVAANAMKEALGFGGDLKANTVDVLEIVRSVVRGIAFAFQFIKDVILSVRLAKAEAEQLFTVGKMSTAAGRVADKIRLEIARSQTPTQVGEAAVTAFDKRLDEAAEQKKQRMAQEAMVKILTSINAKTSPAINTVRAFVGI